MTAWPDQRVPSHAPSALLVQGPESNNSVLVAAVSGRRVLLNPTALALWELCDGETTIAEMVEAVLSLFGEDRGTVEADIRAALLQLEAEELLVWVSTSRAASGLGTTRNDATNADSDSSRRR